MRKILIVEDDTLLNRTMGYNLASEGYEITAAYNRKDAVSHLKETEFDVALLDINLPVVGLTFAKKSEGAASTPISFSLQPTTKKVIC